MIKQARDARHAAGTPIQVGFGGAVRRIGRMRGTRTAAQAAE